jgi:hypothetical protein
MRTISILAVVAIGCHASQPPADTAPIDPSQAATFRGYAAIQNDLYAKFIAPGASFELSLYLGASGDELSKLVGRADGFGVAYGVKNGQPNAMNVLVWRMMLRAFASDLAASCPHSRLASVSSQVLALSDAAKPIVGALCAWPAADDATVGAAWDLVVADLAPAASKAAFVRYARGADLLGRTADDAIPDVWLGALLHPSFLLEQ